MTKNKLTKLIEKSQEKIKDDARDYIGASSIGSPCYRQIWYQFKGVKSKGVPSKTRRTWAIGKNLEHLIFDWLKNAGVKAVIHDETYHAIDMPYFQGHFDGLIDFNKRVSILEIKTAKDASFKLFVKNGVKIWNTQYYAQIQAYMGMSDIVSAYILVLNKDSSELSDELVLFDPDFYENLKEKAQIIYRANTEPPRINGSPLWYLCKMCKYNKICHK